jgi:hypothetical protein
MNQARSSRHPGVGWILTILGIVGVITGVVPFTINALRILADENLWGTVDFAAHGVESLGLSVEWGMLSSAMGAYLGVLLLWAGRGWLRGSRRAALVSWVYVLSGLTVNVTDMIIFAFRARPGPMRSRMLVFDGIALLIPILLAAWLIRLRRRAAGAARRIS